MYEYLSADTNEGRAFAEDAQALLTATADLPVALEHGRASGCGMVRPKVVDSAKTMRRPAIKTVVSLLVILSCGLRSACSATNDAYGCPGGTVIALSGYKSAFQPPPGTVTTTIPEKVLFQYGIKGSDTNTLDSSSNGKLSTPGQQPGPTNTVPQTERATLGLVDVAAVPRIDRRRESFSDQDKYGGILYKAYRAESPLQLINPFAPREYSQREGAELPRDPITGVPSGLSIFSIRFK